MSEQLLHQQELELAPTHQWRFAIKAKLVSWETYKKDLKGKLGAHRASEGGKCKAWKKVR